MTAETSQATSENLPARLSYTVARYENHVEVVTFDPDNLPVVCFTVMGFDLAERHRAVPVNVDGNRVTVAVVDPTNLLLADDVRIALGAYTPEFVAADGALIDATLARWSKINARAVENSALEGMGNGFEDVAQFEIDEEGQMAQLVNQVILSAAQVDASDIHFEPTEDSLEVRFRIDGVLQPHTSFPRKVAGGVINRLKVLGGQGMDVGARLLPQDGRFQRELAGRSLDCRVVTIPTALGREGAIIRLLDRARGTRDLDQIGFRPKFVSRLDEALAIPHGIVLVTGPTGSGKTSTLYSAMGRVATPDRKTLSVEDPVEIRYPGIMQVQVNAAAGLTFSTVLKSFLRADPDVILVGEMRDLETANLATQAALTGHLVLSTLHTNDAVSAATRLTEMGLKEFIVASSLRAVLAQRLVRNLCNTCKQAYAPTEDDFLRVRWSEKIPRPERFYRPVGCLECNKTGYRGRSAIGELVVVNDEFSRAIIDRAPSMELEKIARAAGMIPLHMDALSRVYDGTTSAEEVRRIGV